jgi:ATP-dependent Clp protease ATP-binding subunit ClpA
VQERLAEFDLRVILTAAAKRWLAEQGYDTQFGARPLRRAIQRYVESPLSVTLLGDGFQAGDQILIDEEEGELTFEKEDVPERVEAEGTE